MNRLFYVVLVVALFSCKIGRQSIQKKIKVNIGNQICNKNATSFFANDLCYRINKIDQNISCEFEILENCLIDCSLISKRKKINLRDELLRLIQSDILRIDKLITTSSNKEESVRQIINSQKNLIALDFSEKKNASIIARYDKKELNLRWFSKFRRKLIENQSIDVIQRIDSNTDSISFYFTEPVDLNLKNVLDIAYDNQKLEFWLQFDQSGAKQLSALSAQNIPLLISIDDVAYSNVWFSDQINTGLLKSEVLNFHIDIKGLKERVDIYSKSLGGIIID